jgi:flavorubredoxin
MDNPEGRDFHGIPTPRGGSYNSYLIIDEKPALIDGTNKRFLDDFMESLQSAINPDDIQYIVINHAEPDHAGALKEICSRCKNAKIVCSAKAKDFIENESGPECEFRIVKEGDEIRLGKRTLRFLMDPMVHWPETMMSYLEPEKALFSGDLFGSEVRHEKLFADEMAEFRTLTRDYFALVMRPFNKAVLKAIEKVEKLDLEILMPSHGPVYRKDIPEIVGYYRWLSEIPEEKKVTIIYNSIWHSTERMAHEIAKGAKEEGYEAVVLDLHTENLVRIMAEAMTSKAIALGSLTILGSYHPQFESLFCYLKLNNQPGKRCAVFGTHGWVAQSVPQLKKKLVDIDYNVIDSVDYRFGPKTEEDISRIK